MTKKADREQFAQIILAQQMLLEWVFVGFPGVAANGRFRRASSVAVRPRERPLTELIAGRKNES